MPLSIVKNSRGGCFPKLAKLLPLAATLSMFFAVPSRAQESPSKPVVDPEAFNRLLKRVEELEAELKAMKARDAKPAQPLVENARSQEPNDDMEPQLKSHASHESAARTPKLEIRGFGDLSYRVSNVKGETNTFGLGELDLFITSRLSDRLSILAESVISAGRNNSFSYKLERLLLQYSLNDYLNVGVGRYHTAIGYYNTAYHHGTWFQTATGRPFIFTGEGGGGMLPIHNVGLTVSGQIPSGSLGLRYVAELGNGRRYAPGEEQVQSAVDENNGKAVNFALLSRPAGVPGLQAGFSVYRDNLTPRALPNIRQTVMASHLVYQSSRLELLNELILLRHAPRGTDRVFTTPAFYTQVSHSFGKTRPYVRYQYTNVPVGDPLFRNIGRRNGPSFGVRYELGEFAALKVQYDRTGQRRLDAINAMTLQLAFTF